jgi:hypothetical protein
MQAAALNASSGRESAPTKGLLGKDRSADPKQTLAPNIAVLQNSVPLSLLARADEVIE